MDLSIIIDLDELDYQLPDGTWLPMGINKCRVEIDADREECYWHATGVQFEVEKPRVDGLTFGDWFTDEKTIEMIEQSIRRNKSASEYVDAEIVSSYADAAELRRDANYEGPYRPILISGAVG